MEDNIPSETQTPTPQRPTGLTVLLVFSFIGSGSMAFSYSLWFLMYDFIKTTPAIQDMFKVIPQGVEAVGRVMSGGKYFFLASCLCATASLIGAIMMWNLKRMGFHVYAIAQILLLLMPLLFIGREMIGLSDMFLTVAFIILYASFYRRIGIKL